MTFGGSGCFGYGDSDHSSVIFITIPVAYLGGADLEPRRVAPDDLAALAEQAAGLTAALTPTLAVPHHYAFHSGWLGDRMITKGDQDPRHYADAVARIAPQIDVRLVLPGTTVAVR